jgi:hypothetical protein
VSVSAGFVNFVSFEALQGKVAAILDGFVGREITGALLADVDKALAAEFLFRATSDTQPRVAEGLVVTGARPSVGDDNRLRVQWLTGFHPEARWKAPELGLELMPLGYFEDRDLYLCAMEWGPSRIVSAWGNGPADHMSASHYSLGAEAVRAIGPDFAAALDRLMLLAGLRSRDGMRGKAAGE